MDESSVKLDLQEIDFLEKIGGLTNNYKSYITTFRGNKNTKITYFYNVFNIALKCGGVLSGKPAVLDGSQYFLLPPEIDFKGSGIVIYISDIRLLGGGFLVFVDGEDTFENTEMEPRHGLRAIDGTRKVNLIYDGTRKIAMRYFNDTSSKQYPIVLMKGMKITGKDIGKSTDSVYENIKAVPLRAPSKCINNLQFLSSSQSMIVPPGSFIEKRMVFKSNIPQLLLPNSSAFIGNSLFFISEILFLNTDSMVTYVKIYEGISGGDLNQLAIVYLGAGETRIIRALDTCQGLYIEGGNPPANISVVAKYTEIPNISLL